MARVGTVVLGVLDRTLDAARTWVFSTLNTCAEISSCRS